MQPIADALGAALTAAYPNVAPHVFVPDALEPPAFYIGFPTITYDVDMSGDLSALFDVHVIVSRAHDRSAYAELSPYLLPTGVRAALLADHTLGGVVQSLRVASASVAPINIGGTDFLSATFQAEIYRGP